MWQSRSVAENSLGHTIMNHRLQLRDARPAGAVRVVRTASATAILIGLLVLVGWICDISLLKTALPGLVSMKANTAIAFLLIGVSLEQLMRKNTGRWWSLARTTALAVMLIAGAMLVPFAFDCDPGIDAFPFRDDPRPATQANSSGRMAPLTGAVSFFMFGIALLLLPSKNILARRLVQCLLLATMAISSVALVGYAYGIEALYKFELYSSMAFHTAATFIVVCIGALYLRTDFGIMAPITSQRMGGLVARILLPAAVGVPLLMGWLRLQGEQLGFYHVEFGMAMHTVSTIIAFAVLVWYCAHMLNQADEQREFARNAEYKLRVLSERDPLTNLLNRRSFRERFEREWERSLRYERPLSCIMLDIDLFKIINDTRGHTAGDSVLKAVAEILVEQCRPSDLVARYGGDEFCIIVPETSENGALGVAERLRATLANRWIDVDASRTISASFGVAERGDAYHGFEDLIDRADRALLAAKQAGRDRVVAASSVRNPLAQPFNLASPAPTHDGISQDLYRLSCNDT
jgi:diguanylate cyclase (GGDEF)-like protein